MTPSTKRGLLCAAAAALLAAGSMAAGPGPTLAAPGPASACPGDNGGLTLAPGFCATVFADDLGHIRHLAEGPGGVIYANTWSGVYFPGKPPNTGFLVAMKDANGDGRADAVTHFGQGPSDGVAGGSGVFVHKGYVYAEVDDKIVRYKLAAGQAVPAGKPEVVLSGLPLGGDHPMHPFVIDPAGQLFVDVASATNACQAQNRQPGVKGVDPCTELNTRAGIWKYDAARLGQTFSPAERYATGIRNGEGMAWDAAGRLYVTQHGRDQLNQNWPGLYPDVAAAAELPSETVMQLVKGGDYGWPYCYYDPLRKALVLAPEYGGDGGDGGKAVGRCAQKTGPVAAFPAHWGPNDLAFYNARAFPAAYRGGMFVAFHGSWNRAPTPQGGFNVVFQPMANGKATGPWVAFADGFAGPGKAQGQANYRPTGLLVGSDGALYVSDDNKGRIWRVTYHGPAGAAVAAAPEPRYAAAAPAARPAPTAAALPAGVTRELIASGDQVYHRSSCVGCHGPDARGTAVGSDLASGKFQWGDGSPASIRDTIAKGVPTPKTYRSPMPPMGGSQLTQDELNAVAAYVWSVSHR